jgi:hypothetical protein
MLRALAIAMYGGNLMLLWISRSSLPDPVATRFNSFGFADGFSSQSAHLLTMAGLIVFFAALSLSLPALIRRLPMTWLTLPGIRSLPSRQHLEYHMTRFSHGFAITMALFLLWLQWLTNLANQLRPAQLDLSALYLGMAMMLAAMVLLTIQLIAALRRSDRD